MLVLSRFVNESVDLKLPDGRVFKVMVVRVTDNGKVRLGFDVSDDVVVLRSEVKDRDK